MSTMLSSGIGLLGRHRGFLALALVLLVWIVHPPIIGTYNGSSEGGRAMYPDWGQQKAVFFERAEFGILAAGMTLVILSGGIDLSVGSVMGMASMVFAIVLIKWEWPAGAAIAVALASGAAAGAVNGLLIALFRIQPFVATLSMMVFARGVAKIVSDGAKVQTGSGVASPAVFEAIKSGRVVMFLATLAVLWLLAHRLRFGRHLFAIGGNEEAARLSGIAVRSYKVVAYILCGLTAGLAGLCSTAKLDQGDPEAGNTYELDAIAAVVIGGTSLQGGKGSVLLTLVGFLIVGYIEKYLSLLGWGTAERLMAKGVIIVVAVLVQGRESR